jgi:hypothetical protein
MHLRHLIVLIIDARNVVLRSCNRRHLSSDLNEICHAITAWCFDRSDQINQNSRGSTALSGVRIKQAEKPSLYDVERSGSACIRGCRAAKLALYVRRYSTGRNWWSRSGSNRRPEACKATALPTELRPLIHEGWWARVDSNYRPYAYQAYALTT